MAAGIYRFEGFLIDTGERQLRRDGVALELNARYLDALALLVRRQGELVTKEVFLQEVWRGMAVTDEALTQCIATLRRLLGDSASSPRFIETVPKHGYRFIAAAEILDQNAAASSAAPVAASPASIPVTGGVSRASSPALPVGSWPWRDVLLLSASATGGGGAAGVLGGLFYGFVAAQAGMGAVSVLSVVVMVTVALAMAGGAGVGFGIAAAGVAPGRPWRWAIPGGAIGGLLVGAMVKLLGLDAFNVLLGQSPGDITGASEGLLLGAAVGFAVWLANRRSGPLLSTRSIAMAVIAGGAAGALIPVLGGRLLGGSLEALARNFPDSHLRLDRIGGMFGEAGFGPISSIATGCMEGAVFGGCVVAAMVAAQRSMHHRAGDVQDSTE